MTGAYDKNYLEKARTTLGRMLDFAVYDLKLDIKEFFDRFIVSGIANAFENGDSKTIAGKSGVELAYEVMDKTGEDVRNVKPRYTANRSEEYWTGWALAYYQWKTSLSFAEIVKYIPIDQIKSMYSPYHEMDIRHFADKMNELYNQAKPETNLKIYRKRADLSQKQLADLSDIPVRMIQHYEQRQKNINKAQTEYLVRLSKVLNCDIEDLLELAEKEIGEIFMSKKREPIKTTIQEAIDYWIKFVDECDLSVDWSEANTHCWRCGCEKHLQRCHIIPDSLGGKDCPENIVLLCERCHAEGPNVTDPEIMWDWIKAYKVPLYGTFWSIRGMKEYEFIYKRKVSEELKYILTQIGIEQNSDSFQEEWKTCMDYVMNEASIHFGQPYFNTVTMAGIYRMMLKRFAAEHNVEFPLSHQDETPKTPWWFNV